LPELGARLPMCYRSEQKRTAIWGGFWGG